MSKPTTPVYGRLATCSRQPVYWIAAASVVIASCVACAASLRPRPWTDFYDPRYPDHRVAYELCQAGAEDASAFSRCMQENVVPFPDRDRRRAEPGWMRR